MSSSQKLINKILDRTNALSDLIPVIAADDVTKIFMMEDGYLGYSFLCDPIYWYNESVPDQLEPLLTSDYPQDTLIQITMFGSPDVRQDVREYLGIRGLKEHKYDRDQEKEILKKNGMLNEEAAILNTIEARAEFIEASTVKALDPKTNLKIRNLNVLFTVKIPVKELPPTDYDFSVAYSLKNQTEQLLKQIGLNPYAMDSDTWMHTMRTMLNWQKDATWKTDETESVKNIPLNEQVLDWGSEVVVEKDHIKLNDQYVGVMSVSKWPKDHELIKMMNLVGDSMSGSVGLRDNFAIVLNVHVPPRKIRSKLEVKRQKVNYQAFGPMLKWVPKLANQKYSFDYLFEKLNDGGKPLRAYLQFIVFSKSKDALDKSISSIRSLYQAEKFLTAQEKGNVFLLFMQSLPLCSSLKIAKQMERYRTFSSQHVVHLMPIMGDWKGTRTPIMNFVSRNGQIMNMDLFDSLTNYNCAVAAKSGAGKSFFTNFVIVNYLSIPGNRVWMIDVGRSYEKLAMSLKGEFIVFDENANFSLNPFRLVQEYESEKDKQEHTNMIITVVAAMVSPNGNLSETQYAYLARIIMQMWNEYGQDLTVTMVADELEKSTDQRFRDMGIQMFRFTEKGDYGSYFTNANPPLQFSKNFVVLELEELKAKEDLQTVVLLTLISIIQNAMYLGSRDHAKLVMIDEAWSLIAKGSVAKFVETGYRRFRKYNGSAITITQSVNDLYNTPSGAAIAENSSIFFLLAQKAEALEQLKHSNRLSFTDGVFNLLKSVHTLPGIYSEIFFYTEMGSGVGRLYVDRYQQLLYSTNPKDLTKIKRYTERGYPLLEAISQVVKEEKDQMTEEDNNEMQNNFRMLWEEWDGKYEE
jgi:conjugal transfer ATP-binding protein TraC